MTNKYETRGTKFTSDASNGSGRELPVPEEEVLTPSRRSEWKPRQATDIAAPEPVMRRRRTLFGSYDDVADFQGQIRQSERITKDITALTQAKTEKEEAFIRYERILSERELMPLMIEQDRMNLGVQVAETRGKLHAACQKIRRAKDQAEQDALTDQRNAELETLDFETERTRRQQTLADERARAAHAEELAILKAQTELAEARRKLEQAQRAAEGGVATVDDSDPLEFQQAMTRERKRQDIARAAAKRERAILARVNGDESQLTEEELDELEGIRGAKQRAQRAVDETSALGAIFPQGEEETR
jgi:hypothetical protein